MYWLRCLATSFFPQALAVTHNSSGWTFTDEGRGKWGWVATEEGSSMQLKVRGTWRHGGTDLCVENEPLFCTAIGREK